MMCIIFIATAKNEKSTIINNSLQFLKKAVPFDDHISLKIAKVDRLMELVDIGYL